MVLRSGLRRTTCVRSGDPAWIDTTCKLAQLWQIERMDGREITRAVESLWRSDPSCLHLDLQTCLRTGTPALRSLNKRPGRGNQRRPVKRLINRDAVPTPFAHQSIPRLRRWKRVRRDRPDCLRRHQNSRGQDMKGTVGTTDHSKLEDRSTSRAFASLQSQVTVTQPN